MESFILLFLYFSNIMACQDLNKNKILKNNSNIKYLNTVFRIIIHFLLIKKENKFEEVFNIDKNLSEIYKDNKNFEEEQQKESEKLLDFLKKNID
jgi:hypothetical protein